MKKPLVSVCMMVKNEEEMLPRALESIAGEVDEIVVVDTGSEDRTVEIARQYTDRVFFHEWFDDFAGMRNITLEYARGDWIVILDADDEFRRRDPAVGLRDFVKNARRSVYVFHLENVSAGGEVTTTFNQIRLFRNGKGFRYSGIVHNQLEVGDHKAAPAPFLIRHYGYGLDEEGMERKRRRSEKLLKKMIERGENLPYAHYQLAKIHYSRKDLQRSLEEALEGARILGEHPEYVMYYDIHYLVAANAFNLKKLELAREEAEKLLRADPHNPDAAFILLGYHFEKQDWARVEEAYETYLRCRKHYLEHRETYPYIINMTARHEEAVYMMGEALIRQGRIGELEDRIGDLLESRKRGPHFLNMLAGVLVEHREVGLAADLLERALELDPEFGPARNNLETIRNTPALTSLTLPDQPRFRLHAAPGQKARRQLEEGAACLQEGRFEEAERALRAVVEWMEDADVSEEEREEILAPALEGLGVACKRKGDLEQARDWLARSVALSPHRAEARIALAEVLKKLGAYEEALEQVAPLLEGDHVSFQALLARALIHRERGDLRGAERDLVRLEAMKPDDALAAFNLGSLYWEMGRRLDALDRLARAMRLEPGGTEYMDAYFKAHAALRNRPTVSLCMMVKNEEEHLEAALESAERAVDEIVVVDTGSEDRTVEIAESFGVRLYRHAWFDDFSGMRNITLSYARGDWILILDADEVVEQEDVDRLRQEAGDLSREAVTFRVLSYLNRGRNVSEQNSIRLFRNHLGFRYVGIVHNQLWYRGKCDFSPVRIHHYGYDLGKEGKEKKFNRTYSLLQRRIQKNPDDLVAYYYLIPVCHWVGRLEEAIQAGHKVMELADKLGVDLSKQYFADVFSRVGYLYILNGQWEKARPVLEKGLEVCPEHPELQLSLALCRFLDKDYGSALSHLETSYEWYLKFRSGEFRPFYSVDLDDTLLVGNMANLLLQMDRPEEAREKVNALCAANPDLIKRGLERAREDRDQGNSSGAEWHLRWLRLVEPPDSAFSEAVGEELIRVDRPSDAADYYQERYDSGKELSPKEWELWIRALIEAGEMSRAEEAVRAGREKYPHEVALLRACARLEEARGRHDAAADLWEAVLRKDPHAAGVRNRIGENYYLCHRFEEAEACFRAELEGEGEVPDAYNNLGMIYLGRGRLEEAVELFQRCLEAAPEHAEALQNLEICRRIEAERRSSPDPEGEPPGGPDPETVSESA